MNRLTLFFFLSLGRCWSLALEDLFARRLALARPLLALNQTGAIARALTPALQIDRRAFPLALSALHDFRHHQAIC
jgi:hypothetical protein